MGGGDTEKNKNETISVQAGAAFDVPAWSKKANSGRERSRVAYCRGEDVETAGNTSRLSFRGRPWPVGGAGVLFRELLLWLSVLQEPLC